MASGKKQRRNDLLELWMGEPAEERAPRQHLPAPVIFAGLGVAALATIGLAKYAVDVLLIVVALAGTGLVLHLLGTWLAESDLLSPGWFLIAVLTAALGAWVFFSPAGGIEGLGRYVPEPVVKFFEWSESRGWARRAFIGPGGGGQPPSAAGVGAGVGARTTAPPPSEPASPPSRSLTQPGGSASGGGALTLSASQTRLRAGQPVGLTARVVGDPARASGTVRFYDGGSLLGQAPINRDGAAWVAYLTISLGRGQHRVTAEWNGTKTEGIEITVTR